MGKIITFVSASGGVGKSLLCAHTAAALAPLCGNRLLFIDASFGIGDAKRSLGCDSETPYDLGDVLAGRCDAADAVCRCRGFLLMTPPGDGSRAAPESVMSLARTLSPQCEYIVIDCPVTCAKETAVFAEGSDVCVLCTTADEAACAKASLLRRSLPREDERVRLAVTKYDTAALRRGELMNIDSCIDTVCARLIAVAPLGIDRTQHACANLARRIAGEDVPLMHI